MEQFKPSSPLSLEGNTSENWKRWKQRFELYLKATEADRKDKEIQVAILLHCIGEDGLEAFKTYEFEREEDKKKIRVMWYCRNMMITVVLGRILCSNGLRFGIGVNRREKL